MGPLDPSNPNFPVYVALMEGRSPSAVPKTTALDLGSFSRWSWPSSHSASLSRLLSFKDWLLPAPFRMGGCLAPIASS